MQLPRLELTDIEGSIGIDKAEDSDSKVKSPVRKHGVLHSSASLPKKSSPIIGTKVVIVIQVVFPSPPNIMLPDQN